VLSPKDLRGILRELKKLGFTGMNLHFGGGEPFFNYKHLIECMEVAKEEGMLPLGKLETNGFWCKNEKLARERLHEIKGYGIGRLSISCDPFHQEYIPIETIQQAERIATEILGEDVVRVVPRELLDNPFDMMALSHDEKTEVFREVLSRYPMRIMGRAAKQLAHLVEKFPKEKFVNEHCGRKLMWKGSIHIDPYGNVFPSVCAGINVGNATETPLSKIHGDFDYDAHPMVKTLVEKGPLPLMEEAIERGFADKKEGYATKCHLCYEARCFFWEQGMYHDEIGPGEVYVD
jgi:MoaA/NifB/PqqE/SkfB family radical SAM enzyme